MSHTHSARKGNKRIVRTAVLAATGGLLLAGSAKAATSTWNVQMSGGPFDWNTAANWNAGAGPVPVGGDTAAVNQNYTGNLSIDISADAVLQVLNIGDSTTTTVGGTDYVNVSIGSANASTLTFDVLAGTGGAGTISSSGGSNSIANYLVMTTAAATTGMTINGNSGTLTISGDLTGAANVVIGGNNNATYPGLLAPTVANMNPGIVAFSGAKTFTGTLTVNANAPLRVNSAAAMGSGAGAYITVSGTLADGFGMAAGDLAKITTGSSGALAIAGNTAQPYDLATPGLNSLRLGSTVLGDAASGGATYTGAYTAGTNGYLFGGGGVATKLIVGAGVLSGATAVNVAGNGITELNTANVNTGDTRATGGTLYLNHANAAQSVTALTTVGTTPTAGGAILLNPATVYAGPGVTLDNGAIGWSGNYTITGLPGTYSTTTVAGTAGVTPVKLLNLGGTHSTGTMSQDGTYALQDDAGPIAVEVVKSGVNSTLDLTNAPVGGNLFTGGMDIVGGTVVFNNVNQLGAGVSGGTARVAVGAGGILQLPAQPVPTTVTIPTQLDPNGGNLFASATAATIDVAGANDKITFTQQLFQQVNRDAIRKVGPGTLEILGGSSLSFATKSSWGVQVAGGTFRTDHLPYQSSASAAAGFLYFAADGTFDLLPLPVAAPGTNFNGGYGFQAVQVAPGVTGTITIAANTVFKDTGRANSGQVIVPATSTLIVQGTDLTSEYRHGDTGSGGAYSTTGNGGTLDLRKVYFSLFTGQSHSPMFPSQTDFTMKLNDAKVDNAAGWALQGNLVINDLGGTTLSQVGTWNVANVGNTTWNATLEKIGTGAFTLNRTGGTATVAVGAKLLNNSTGTGRIDIGGTADPLHDLSSGNKVTIENNADTYTSATANHGLNFSGGAAKTAKEIVTTLGTPTVGTLRVTGSDTVLATEKVIQRVVSVNAGATLKIAADPTTSQMQALNLDGGIGAWTAALDIDTNRLVYDYNNATTAATPYATVKDQIISGYADGLWTGQGIRSTDAAGNPVHAVGYSESVNVSLPGGIWAFGNSTAVDADAVLVATTRIGDATLDGLVNFNDLLRLSQNYNLPGDWAQADFNYDGTVNFNDLLKLSQNYNQSFSSAQPAGGAAVPEPGVLGVLAMGAMGLLARRRRA